MNANTAKVPLFSAQAANAGLDLTSAVKRVIDSHWYVLGKEVESFEQEFAQYQGSDHCISLGNGTDALELALRAVGVKAGDVVVTVANAGFYSSTAILSIGATPVYVDVDGVTLTMSPAALEEALKDRPKAVVVTHLFGRTCVFSLICRLAEAAGVPLFEDSAQAQGATVEVRRVGIFGALGCFSFYPTKNLGALGAGGAVVTSDASLAQTVRQLRQCGWSKKYHVDLAGGGNSRLDEMQAAILREKLPHLDGWNEQRRAIARSYNGAFAGLPLRCPDALDSSYVGHLYVVRSKQREALRDHLAQQGISTDIHYPVPDHQQTVMKGRTHAQLPITESSAVEALTLPCFPGLTEVEVQRVIEAVKGFFSQ